MVSAGLSAGEDDVIHDALTRLKQTLPQVSARPSSQGKRNKLVRTGSPNLTLEHLHQQMLSDGLITQLPDTDADFDDPDDQPIAIEGEPLSETIIRERR